MEAVAGVFRSVDDARLAYANLRRAGFSPDDLNLLFPGAPEEKVHAVPVSETEQPGMGTAIGGVVGGALGAAGGFELGALGTAAASSLVPGVGPIVAIGVAAAALFGVGGAVAGAAIGSTAEERSTPGLPADEVFFYEDALRQGRAVMIVMANGKGEAERARELLSDSGAETVDAARDAWWIGLRDAEQERYNAGGGNFDVDQDTYRKGFEAAQRREFRDRSYDEVADQLKRDYPDVWNSGAFRHGFESGALWRRDREKVTTDASWYGG